MKFVHMERRERSSPLGALRLIWLICKGKLEIVTCTRETRYDFEFSVANASENDHNAPKARYDCAPCSVKCLACTSVETARFKHVSECHGFLS